MKRSLRALRTALRLVGTSSPSLLVGFSWALAAERILESDARHVLLEIIPSEIPVTTVETSEREYVRFVPTRIGTTDETGKPEVPRAGVRVALPAGAVPRLRIVEQQWSPSRPGAVLPVPERVAVREAFRPNQVIEREPVEGADYRAAPTYPPRVFELSEIRDLRGVPVVTLSYHPVVAEVFTRSHKVLERAVVEIVFETPRGRSILPTSRPAPNELWERTLRNTVANSDDAARFARGGIGDGTTVGDSPWGGGNQWRVRVDATGITELTYSLLSGAGFPSGVPVDEVSVYQRTFDLDSVDDPATAAADLFVPIPVPGLMRDRNSNGVFDGDDGIVVYERSFRDQWMTSGMEHEDKYDGTNYMWVRRDPAGGARMVLSRPGGSLSGTAVDSLETTPCTYFREDDRRYNDHPPDHGNGPADFEADPYAFNAARVPAGEKGWGLTQTFTAFDAAPNRPTLIRTRVTPGGKIHRFFTNRLQYHLNDDLVGEDVFYNASLYSGSNYVPPENCLWTHTAPAGTLVDGQNSFRFWAWTYVGASTITPNNDGRYYIDWWEVTYERLLLANGDQLALSTEYGPPTEVLVRVSGFAGSDLLLFDVTEAAQPQSVGIDDASQIVGAGPYDLRFDHDNAGGSGGYVAVSEAAIPAVTADRVTLVPAPSVLAGGVGREYVVLSYDDFMTGAQSLASYRASEYSTHTVATSWVYDVFNNGSRHPSAIKGFAAYAYHRWTDPLVFLVLVGDANEDHLGVGGSDSSPDLLPSHSLYADYEGAPEDSDQYYAELTRPMPGTPFDDLADIYIGRIPVNTSEELAWQVQRIIEYETRDLDADWRRRVLFLADDQFSGSLGGGLGTAYGWQPFENGFETVSNELKERLNDHPYDQLEAQCILLADWNHPCPDNCYTSHATDCENELGRDCGFWYDCRNAQNWVPEYVCMKDSTFQNVHPVLRDELNEGVLLWNYQGHANRFFLAHEEVFKDFAFRTDVETSLHNDGKPFIFLGYACHLAEFDKFDEGAVLDCVSEKMLNLRPFADSRPGGAIAVFASSGYEFLGPNLVFNTFTIESFFYPELALDAGALPPDAVPPLVGDPSLYKWTLGESTTRSRLMYQTQYSSNRNRQAAQRFVLLGDPALSPRAGAPALSVTVDGLDVQDPGVPFFADGSDAVAPVTVRVVARNGRGLTGVRIVDSVLGEVDAADYQVTDGEISPDGVVREKAFEYTFDLRGDQADYDVDFLALDPDGNPATFTVRVTSRFGFVEGEPPAIFPNPFQRDMNFLYKLTNQADEVRMRVYTVNGRKIHEATEVAKMPNVVHRFVWDGRDSNGNLVANGSYLVRFQATSEDAKLDATVTAVRMH